ncbi:TetR/AcrR family transcriptional regulator [Shewanella gelidii]|uniref:TetR/AcrR family transcriptional regulator n=1 Tax=Shewanella gelidii TaxID=1642821 RepID=A0A917NAS4_9GAMM|nr:TetR/AcrR family transcriptional regulator [Shewanella gelidii]MCL1098477.1 TetR/AcrR family transcriptional regulator [Shewanella gelidii]GGI82454.1 hypothetical protein GCM10009332_19590 [Shewanella gelidii]
MSSWQQREQFLIGVAQRCLQGSKVFDLRRSHLVAASQISKGTIYNHFATEADLIVAIASDNYQHWLALAERDSLTYTDPLKLFLFHHCGRIRESLEHHRFVIERVMPNEDILSQASEAHRQAFELHHGRYERWNREAIAKVGEVFGFDRTELVCNYLRGNMINCDDADKSFDDLQMYHQFCFALLQLMGHSDKRIPYHQEFVDWLGAQRCAA